MSEQTILHDQARESAQRLINSHFCQEPGARISIPARPGHDDDLVICAYIEQQRQADAALQAAIRERDEARAEVERLRSVLNAPEIADFTSAVQREAAHQRERWGVEHDATKEPADWFQLIGYLAGKALQAHIDGRAEKALHHAITTAAATCNWHAAILKAQPPPIAEGRAAERRGCGAAGTCADAARLVRRA